MPRSQLVKKIIILLTKPWVGMNNSVSFLHGRTNNTIFTVLPGYYSFLYSTEIQNGSLTDVNICLIISKLWYKNLLVSGFIPVTFFYQLASSSEGIDLC